MKKFVFGVVILLASFGMGVAQAADIALLDSAVNTAKYFKQHYGFCSPSGPGSADAIGELEYRRYFLGWEYVLKEIGITDTSTPHQYDIIHDSDIVNGNLDTYEILILSNDPSLSTDQIRAIHQWVIRGGKLLATFGSGYEGLIETTQEFLDDAKLHKGHTDGLHQLWRDPYNKVLTSHAIEMEQNNCAGGTEPVVKLPLSGPTAQVKTLCGPDAGTGTGLCPHFPVLTGYGDNHNVLIQRPATYLDVFGFGLFRENIVPPDAKLCGADNSVDWKRPMPGIMANRIGKGQAVYYAFAPEFIVALEFDLAGHCSNDSNYDPDGDGVVCQNLPGPPVPGIPSPCAANPLTAVRENLFEGRSNALRPLMKSTLNYLLQELP